MYNDCVAPVSNGGGCLVVIDRGRSHDNWVVYYNLEQLWTSKESTNEQSQSQTQVNISVIIISFYDMVTFFFNH